MTPASSIARITLVAAPALATVLSGHFAARSDWRCHTASSPDGLLVVDAPSPDLLILDVDACRAPSPEALTWLRAFTGPAILIGDNDKDALPVAVVAHLPRPFRLTALVDYIQAALIRPPLSSHAQAPASLRLTEKEAAIFTRLAAAGGGTVPRTQLLSEVWGYGPGVSTRTLETHISRLRRKIATAPGGCWRLLSAAGGYRLVDSLAATPENSGDRDENPLVT